MIRQDTVTPAHAAIVRPRWVRTYRFVAAVLTLAALIFQFWYSNVTIPDYNPVNFWLYFTIQSNLIAVFVLLWGAIGDPQVRSDATIDMARGGALLFMTITFVVYGVLLAGYEDELNTPVPWVNNVLHRITPIVLMVDWLISPPRGPIPLKRALLWLLYPLLYAGLTLLRGSIVGWYPYPFLNPANVGGYGGVALYAVGIAIASALFAWLVVLVGRHLRLVVTP